MDSDVEDAIYAHMYFEEFSGVQEVSGETIPWLHQVEIIIPIK